jgi:hypothetical protein
MYVLMGGTQTRVEGLKPDVIILSGGPNSVHVDGAPTVRSYRPSHHHACTYLSIRLRRTRRRRKHHLIAARESVLRGRSMPHAPTAVMQSSQWSMHAVHAPHRSHRRGMAVWGVFWGRGTGGGSVPASR